MTMSAAIRMAIVLKTCMSFLEFMFSIAKSSFLQNWENEQLNTFIWIQEKLRVA
jgi:hypothetical protein